MPNYRHTQNHKGPALGCSACQMAEEFDRSRKFERMVIKVAQPRTKGKHPRKSVVRVDLSGV